MWDQLTVEQLKAELTSRGLDTTGLKAVLVSRLQAADASNRCTNIPNNGSTNSEGINSSRFKIGDIEDLISRFNGTNNVNVKTWIKDFEEIANMLRLNDIEKFVFMKKQLAGTARIFARTITCRSYSDLKHNLIAEFEKQVCKADIYLQQRRKKSLESFRAYYYKIIEIANKANVDKLSIIHFIINGINNKEEQKQILYNATTLEELKNKLDIYERIKSKQPRTENREKQDFRRFDTKSEKTHCFNCESKEHWRKDCKAQTKCFICNNHGHTTSDCPHKSTRQSNFIEVQYVKEIQIKDQLVQALIDTGSDITILREDAYRKIKNTFLTKSKLNLIGLGLGKTQSTGCFNSPFKIDNIELATTFHVVPKQSIKVECILGKGTIAKAKVIIDNNNITFYNSQQENSLLTIGVDKDLEIDFHPQYAEDIKALIKNYKPKKNFQCPLSVSTVLSNERTIYSPECESADRFSPNPSFINQSQKIGITNELNEENKITDELNLPPTTQETVIIEKDEEMFSCVGLIKSIKLSTGVNESGPTINKDNESTTTHPQRGRRVRGLFSLGVLIAIVVFISKLKYPEWEHISNQVSPLLARRVGDLELQNNYLRAEIDVISKQLNYLNLQNDKTPYNKDEMENVKIQFNGNRKNRDKTKIWRSREFDDIRPIETDVRKPIEKPPSLPAPINDDHPSNQFKDYKKDSKEKQQFYKKRKNTKYGDDWDEKMMENRKEQRKKHHHDSNQYTERGTSRKEAEVWEHHEVSYIVTEKTTQLKVGKKFSLDSSDPYEITKKSNHGRYTVRRCFNSATNHHHELRQYETLADRRYTPNRKRRRPARAER